MYIISITSTDANKLERIQQKFAALCFKRYFNPEAHYSYSFVLEELRLRVRRHHLDAFFLTQVYSGSKFCPSVELCNPFLFLFICNFSSKDVCIWSEYYNL
jgi:hypothetical protein